MKFVLNKTYYRGNVYEWNLPTGWSCPFAYECLVKVDKKTGKFANKSNAYKCYAAAAERFPGVREMRWKNYEHVKNGNPIIIPADARAIRVHMSGDFFSQEYFDTWMELARNNPGVEFWAYTKSLNYWVARIDTIPANFILTASYGGRHDYLIAKHNLKNVIIVAHAGHITDGRPIDTNDDYARMPFINFALLDVNTKGKRKQKKQTKK